MYVARLAEAAAARGVSIMVVLSASGRRSPEFDEFLAPVQHIFKLRVLPDCRPISDYLNQTAHGRPILLDGDRYLRALIRQRPPSGTVILLMRARMKGARGVIGCLLKAVIAAFLILFSAARVVRLSSSTQGTDCSRLLRWLPFVVDPDPVRAEPFSADETSNLPLLPGRYALVAGRIDDRKSVAHLIDWVINTGLDDVSLVLAGRTTDKVRANIDSRLTPPRSSSVVVIDRFMTDAELLHLYSRAAAVMCLYENEGPSGAVTFARLVGVPVIAWGSRQLIAQASEAGILVLCADRSTASIDIAVEAALAKSRPASKHNGQEADLFAAPLLALAGSTSHAIQAEA